MLPTPTVMDMGSNYTPEEWAAWKAKQKAAHNNGNGHGASLTQEALTMLPTPTCQAAKHPTMDDRGTGTPDDSNLWSVAGRIGDITRQQLSGGSPSLGEAHQPQLFDVVNEND
jgi:DNA (cytosine-5)-methyltransferase 1